MHVKEEYRQFNAEQAWQTIVEYVKKNGHIRTVSGIELSAKFVGSCIFIKGGTPGTKRADKGEYLTGKDFMAAYEVVKDWEEINTGNVKPHIRRQQTPFIALLHCAGILE